MFDFGRANKEQREAIRSVDGPLLILAGPGTGKTFTLVQRTIYLIKEKGVKAEQIMLATYTEKAAKELVTRISNELGKLSINININDMYIGTFHSICLRFIKDYMERTQMKKNYRILDGFEQQYIIFKNMKRFLELQGFASVIQLEKEKKTNNRNKIRKTQWELASEIQKLVNELTEELVDYNALQNDENPKIQAVGRILQMYCTVLSERNSIDYSGILAEAYKLLNENPDVLSELQDKIKYIMVDEYQDSNYIQECITFLLAGKTKNICVVGDDDQGLYRFRRATIRNILEFKDKFDEEIHSVTLKTNYRSNSDIVDFYTEWMKTTSGRDFGFEWGRYRIDKELNAYNTSKLSSPAVVKITADNDREQWLQSNLDFVRALLASGKVNNLNQIAFLFRTVKLGDAVELENFFEKNGIKVYSPRASMFFSRVEIKRLLGFLMLCFPNYTDKLKNRSFIIKINKDLYGYYKDCIESANDFLRTYEGIPLKEFILRHRKAHKLLQGSTDYNFTGLLYKMFAFEPFKSVLNTDMNSGLVDLRPLRNISALTDNLAEYEYLENIEKLSQGVVERKVEHLFNIYLRYLIQSGIREYEDDVEYAPSDFVSFMTIHQSKGMEFPVVAVGSLDENPKESHSIILPEIEEKYYRRKPFEPAESIKYFDFWRIYYTAFSRAQNLLALTSNLNSKEPSDCFSACFDKTADWKDECFNIDEFTFDKIKKVDLKESYSFTSHVAVYRECPVKYKFFKELGFTPVRVTATIFGSLVHQTIEDIHRAVLRKEEHLITEENIRAWLMTNYAAISKSEHAYLGKSQINAAYAQVVRYAKKQKNRWHQIKEAEVEISLVKDDYIIKGTVDLIRGEGDTLEIVDFKSEKKPDKVSDNERINRYKKQMQVYAHLVEKKTGKRVSKLHIYYTADESDEPIVSFDNTPADVQAAICEFDDVVHKIQQRDFNSKAENKAVCSSCDFRYYCNRVSNEECGENQQDSVNSRALMRKLSCDDAEVKWAKETALKKLKGSHKYLVKKKGKQDAFLDLFVNDLAKNIIKSWVDSIEGLSAIEYDRVRKDFNYRAPYDLAINNFSVRVTAYLDKKVNCSIEEIISRRSIILNSKEKKIPNVLLQVVFISTVKSADNTDGSFDENKLVSEFCNSCTAYAVGWVSDKDQSEARQKNDKQIAVGESRTMPELISSLQRFKGKLHICEICGAIKEERTNRATNEKFWGCPYYYKHKKQTS